MRIALLLAVVTAAMFSSPTARAADVGVKPEELVGDWTIKGDSLGDAKYTITFAADNVVTLKMKAGSSEAKPSTAKWSYTEGRISFEGTATLPGIKATGTWVTDWTSADEILITVARGNQYVLKRVVPKK